MTVLGLTLFAGRLEGRGFLIFWAVCWLLAFLALATALVDMDVMSARAREEHRQLAKETAADIDASSRRGQSDATTGSTAKRP